MYIHNYNYMVSYRNGSEKESRLANKIKMVKNVTSFNTSGTYYYPLITWFFKLGVDICTF